MYLIKNTFCNDFYRFVNLITIFDSLCCTICLTVIVSFVQVGVCFATEHGLKIVVEDSKCVQANTFIGSEIFQVKRSYFR